MLPQRILKAHLAPKLLGHADIKLTLGIYSHFLPSMGDYAANAMESPRLNALRYGCGELVPALCRNLLSSPRCSCKNIAIFLEIRRADSNSLLLLQLRVIIHALQGVAEPCISCISNGDSVLWFAACCTILRSRWCRSGVNRGTSASRLCSLVARTRSTSSTSPSTPAYT